MYYDGEYWVLKTKNNFGDPRVRSKSDKDIFPPTKWTVWVWNKEDKGSWLPDNQVKIVTGSELTKYKPCQKVTISFDGTPPKIIDDAFGDYLPTNEYLHGRTVFKNQEKNATLYVSSHYNWLVVAENEVEGSSEVQYLIHSWAAGDMNPASDRNSQCISRCVKGGWESKSWWHRVNEEDETMREKSDRIKVSCQGTKEDESSDGNDHDGESKIESSKNIDNSGNGSNVEGSNSENWINIEDPKKEVSSNGRKESSDATEVRESETEGSGTNIVVAETESSTGNKDY